MSTRKVTLQSPREEIIAAWLERLRDPASKQAHSLLNDGDGAMCCLGHLCEVLGVETTLNGAGKVTYLGEYHYLPGPVVAAVGLRTWDGEFGSADDETLNDLAELNDEACKTLSEIADIIESRPPGLFVEEPAR